MDVFEFRDNLISDYERFSRSFTTIKAEDIRHAVDVAYEGGRYWPEPLIQLNPNFVQGGSIEDFTSSGLLDPECAKIFRIKSATDTFGKTLTLYKHQAEAIKIAKRQESYVLTTGTGSGKSLSYFIPIVDDVLQRKSAGDPCNGITAIVVYPMNALCNSQLEQLGRFLTLGYGVGKEPVTFARYTGQESQEDRERIAKNPPDILLTNYVMLELIMTRFEQTDKAVRQHAAGLSYLVLDELHTYRGRQGADVAMLVRRVRERFNQDLLCIGTSATMGSEGTTESRDQAVAGIASKLFGVTVNPNNIITETLEPVTQLGLHEDRTGLRDTVERGVQTNPSHDELSSQPVAAWVEHNLGLEKRDGKYVRLAQPLTIFQAAERLAADTNLNVEDCRQYLAEFLLAAYQSKNVKGQSFFAFRLHQFVSGAWNAFSTLEAPEERYVTLQGQQFKPGDRDRLLFTLSFCRECGQEYFPVWAEVEFKEPISFSPRDLTERSNEDEEMQYGFLMPDPSGKFNPADLERQYPENWLEFQNGVPRLKPHFRRYRPLGIQVDTLGRVVSEGLPAWFIPNAFRFCLNPDCSATFEGTSRSDLSKLSGLSSEGRSSATTVLALSSLKHLIGTDLDDSTKKLLAFTDNRQDASLQAGHFNDFIQILLLRGALLAAIRREPDEHLTDELLTQRVLDCLHLDPTDFAANPEAKGPRAQTTEKALRDVLGYRLYYDLRRGWRITNPNLEQLKLLQIQYQGLKECCQDEAEWQERHPLLGSVSSKVRCEIVHELLDRMRKALCIKTIYLDQYVQERIRNQSFNQLKEPWGFSEDETLTSGFFMIPRPSSRRRFQEQGILHVSHRSAFGRWLKSQARWGQENPLYPEKFDEDTYNELIDDVLSVLTVYGYVEPTELDDGRVGYQINSSVLEWRVAMESSDGDGNTTNDFFLNLYGNIAAILNSSDRFLHQLEAREHTAQVDADVREEREERFRKGLQKERIVDGKIEPAGLPILFCSPTMELGVDIASLNAVYMRNVPPTPANYAQRSGRAGRSGQPALVVTYCAARAPHDQYFFSKQTNMVAGIVRTPTIDLANEDLVRSHFHAVWLAETGVVLGKSVREVLDREKFEELPLRQDLADQIEAPYVVLNAKGRARRILDTLTDDLSKQFAPWYTETWLDSTMNTAKRNFDDAFDRWRSLYKATSSQIKSANAILNNAAATERDRREAKARHDEAYTQQNLLLDSRPTMNSDFYTYRYLAAEGFLPGYNFPRLPLMAFIPGRRERVARDSFLSRPRFLGLSEFGPQSFIYHEGSAYRVRRAILTIREDASVAGPTNLPVQSARICPSCGYGHFNEQREFERCVNCYDFLEGGRRVSNLYRIEQVSTRRAMRITSDEEERQRQGYEMITTLRFAQESGHPKVEAAAIQDNDETILELKYGSASTLWRVNLGWRRRQEKTIYGFSIDANTGEWTKDAQAPTDAEDDKVTDGKSVERVTPFVEDTRNVIIIQPKIDLSQAAMISFQYALKRGIEQEYQLEEAELAAEPLPDRDTCNAILLYEAAEGGAGVLTRLASDPDAIPRIARKALEVCHFSSNSGGWENSADLRDEDQECEAGCYRCLLSYYNQLDHKWIDRQNPEMIDLFLRLARGQRKNLEAPLSADDTFDEMMNASESNLEQEWLNFLKENDYHLPDRAQPTLQDYGTRPDFAYTDHQTLIYIDGPHHNVQTRQDLDADITRRLEDAGFTVVRFGVSRSSWRSRMEEYAWVFGQGSDSVTD
ncbi:MAG: DEAD/DEAH box helicase [Caldilineaceae bacterium]|nr:DEAD/DEAH box helicase [Caldilineaceae bacterium]